MQEKTLSFLAIALMVQALLPGASCLARAQTEKTPYPSMAPVDQYAMPDANSEIALARTAAPSMPNPAGKSSLYSPCDGTCR